MHTARRVITTAFIATVALAAASAPAIAYPIGPGFGVRSTSHVATTASYSRQDKQVVTPATYAAQPVSNPGQPTRVSAPTGGFTALDAAFAAAGGLALLLLVMGSAAALLRRRSRGVQHPATAH